MEITDTPIGDKLQFAKETLDKYFGFSSFLEGQADVIQAVADGHDCLVVMPTGGGKSLCFQLPALMRDGITLVISPLIALMKDQVDSLKARGIRATLINSSLSYDEQKARINAVRRGEFQLVYVAPERFRSEWFLSVLCNEVKVTLLAVDEAHCVSQWGHDFRPDYLRLRDITTKIGRPQMIALTATATPFVRADIIKELGLRQPRHFVAGFNRPNLRIRVAQTETDSDKANELQNLIGRTQGSGIVFSATRKGVETVTAMLNSRGFSAAGYHAGMDEPTRKRVQDDFMSGKTRIIVATNAFGMGVDKPDIRFVVHYQIPDSIESYYQEIGRGGRDGAPAECLLLFNYADKTTQDYFIEGSYPQPDIIEEVYLSLVETRRKDIELGIEEISKRSGIRNQMAVRSSLIILEKAGHIVRGNAAENLATIIPRKDLVKYADFNAKETQSLTLLRAIIARHEPELDQPIQISINRLASDCSLSRPQTVASITKLQDLGVLDYEPSFRGRGIRMLDERPPVPLKINKQELARRAANEQLKLRKMIDFAYHKGCLRNFILSYFADTHDRQPCGQCGNCNPYIFRAKVITNNAASPGTLQISRKASATKVENFIIENAPSGKALRDELSQRSQDRKLVTQSTPISKSATITEDQHRTVRIILSCVARMNGRFGKRMVANVLKGSKAKQVLSSRLDKLSTYGLLNTMTVDEIVKWLDILQRGKLVTTTEGEYPTIHLTDQGREVMIGTSMPQMRLPQL